MPPPPKASGGEHDHDAKDHITGQSIRSKLRVILTSYDLDGAIAATQRDDSHILSWPCAAPAGDFDLDENEIQKLYQDLLQHTATPDEVSEFEAMHMEQRVDKLLESTTALQVDQVYLDLDAHKHSGQQMAQRAATDSEEEEEGGSLLDPKPSRKKVEKIVAILDKDEDGQMSVAEIKVLFSKLLQIPEQDIADDDREGMVTHCAPLDPTPISSDWQCRFSLAVADVCHVCPSVLVVC